MDMLVIILMASKLKKYISTRRAQKYASNIHFSKSFFKSVKKMKLVYTHVRGLSKTQTKFSLFINQKWLCPSTFLARVEKGLCQRNYNTALIK